MSVLSFPVKLLMVHKTDIRCMSCISYATKCFQWSPHYLRPINFPLITIDNISKRRFDSHLLAKKIILNACHEPFPKPCRSI